MKPTDILIEEHNVIKVGLSCLEKLVTSAGTAEKLDPEAAHEVLGFLRDYADKFHHAKEEAELFPMMKRKQGFKGGCSPVVVLIREHELGRCYIDGMRTHLEEAAAGNAEGLRWFTENAQSYLKLLRDHMKKEDFCLFPAANKALDEAEQRQLSERFETIAREQACDEAVARLHRAAARLGVSPDR